MTYLAKFKDSPTDFELELLISDVISIASRKLTGQTISQAEKSVLDRFAKSVHATLAERQSAKTALSEDLVPAESLRGALQDVISSLEYVPASAATFNAEELGNIYDLLQNLQDDSITEADLECLLNILVDHDGVTEHKVALFQEAVNQVGGSTR